jgi:ribonuclease HI
MTYRISYDDGWASDAIRRTEYYRTEFEALGRARELLEDGDHHGIAIHSDSDSVLMGIRLELKWGWWPQTKRPLASSFGRLAKGALFAAGWRCA